jgi:hypothetical protein
MGEVIAIGFEFFCWSGRNTVPQNNAARLVLRVIYPVCVHGGKPHLLMALMKISDAGADLIAIPVLPA